MKRLYMAGNLFSLGERMFNRILRDALVARGHEVFLPQEKESEARIQNNPKLVAEQDIEGIRWSDVVLVNLDGPDPDSGTSLEAGFALGIQKPTIGYRTDFRDVGGGAACRVNLMFELLDTFIFYSDENVEGLAQALHEAVEAKDL